jgi:hypothetical protein
LLSTEREYRLSSETLFEVVTVCNNNIREPASKGADTPVLWLVRHLTHCAEKQCKKEQQELEEEQENDGEEITKKSKHGVYSIPGRLLIIIVPQVSILLVPSVSPLILLSSCHSSLHYFSSSSKAQINLQN